MSLKLGTTGIALPYSKAYLGSILKYQKSGGGYIDTEFTACPFPTDWTEVVQGLDYTATNDYGLWRIWADTAQLNTLASYNHPVINMFDGTSNAMAGYYSPEELDSDTAVTYAGIHLPSGVTINPTQINLDFCYAGNTTLKSTIEGLNENGEWETLTTLKRYSSKKAETIQISSNKFYSSFRLKLSRYSSSNAAPRIYEFQITSGTIRKEAK